MNMHEYNERVKPENRVESEYGNKTWEAVTVAYIAMDFDKNIFCKIVDTIGLAEIEKKSKHFTYLFIAADEKRYNDEVKRKQERKMEIEQEIRNLEEEYESLK